MHMYTGDEYVYMHKEMYTIKIIHMHMYTGDEYVHMHKEMYTGNEYVHMHKEKNTIKIIDMHMHTGNKYVHMHKENEWFQLAIYVASYSYTMYFLQFHQLYIIQKFIALR